MELTISQPQWEAIKKHLEAFLARKGYRQTQERWMILEEIYSRQDHFNAEELYQAMADKKFRLSRATIYNNLDLLIECGLVRKHQFDHQMARYEKASGFRQHSHLICLDCRQVTEFCDPRLQMIQETVGKVLEFEVQQHELLLYGNCTNKHCQNRKPNS